MPIVTMDETSELSRVFLNDEIQLDVEKSREEILGAATKFVIDHPHVGAILLESTIMVPFTSAIRFATGLPVFSIYSLILWFYAVLSPREFVG